MLCVFLPKSGFLFIQNLCNLPIDFLCGLWYNGNSARRERVRAAEKMRKEVGGFPPPLVDYHFNLKILLLIQHHTCGNLVTEQYLTNPIRNIPIMSGAPIK